MTEPLLSPGIVIGTGPSAVVLEHPCPLAGHDRATLWAAMRAVAARRATPAQHAVVDALLQLQRAYADRGGLSLDGDAAAAVAAAIGYLCAQVALRTRYGVVRFVPDGLIPPLPWVTTDAAGRVVRRSASLRQAQQPMTRDLFAADAPVAAQDGPGRTERAGAAR